MKKNNDVKIFAGSLGGDGGDRSFVFGGLFFAANNLETFLDRSLSPDGLTTKQWLLSVIVNRFGPEGCTLSEAARAFCCSHQNIKQIALKLEKNGYLLLQKDTHDARTLRLTLTAKSKKYWKDRGEANIAVRNSISAGMSDDEIRAVRIFFERIFAITGSSFPAE